MENRIMKNEKQIKKTPLHSWHLAHGANMAPFGGYEMPLWYPSGVKLEHLAVLSGAGMFDTSHMAVIMSEGPGALPFFRTVSPKTGCVHRKEQDPSYTRKMRLWCLFRRPWSCQR